MNAADGGGAGQAAESEKRHVLQNSRIKKKNKQTKIFSGTIKSNAKENISIEVSNKMNETTDQNKIWKDK